MEEYLDVKIYVTELMALYIISRDRMIMNQIEIEQQKLISLDPSKHEGLTIDQCLVHLSKWMGGKPISKRDISIVEFKTMLEEWQKQ